MSEPLDLAAALAALSDERPVFHSEADFQHSLAWVIRGQHEDIEVRLERPVTRDGKRAHLDIWLFNADGPKVIELKYWTREAGTRPSTTRVPTAGTRCAASGFVMTYGRTSCARTAYRARGEPMAATRSR